MSIVAMFNRVQIKQIVVVKKKFEIKIRRLI